jgi:lipoate-protein ligase A
MAVDEALLESYARGGSRRAPTLRLYAWAPAALSLGRSQPAGGACDRGYLREESIDLVRRPTGGRAVLHEHERTYAVIGSLSHPPFDGGVHQVYRRIGEALRQALGRIGLSARLADASIASPVPSRAEGSLAACFDGPGAHEIVTGGMKLIGSAQLRRRRAFLQHGSILVDSDAERLARAVGTRSAPAGFTDLRRALGREVGHDEVDRALKQAFASCFDVELEPGDLSVAEQRRAALLRCWKYDSAAWTLEGRLGERELHWCPSLST